MFSSWVLYCAVRVATKMQMSPSLPFLKRPSNLDGTAAGDIGFDPIGFSNVFDVKFLQEAEIKHGRVAMLAAAGAIAQDLFLFPGVSSVVGSAKMTGVHDILVQQGSLKQLLFWTSFLEIIGTVALLETIEGKRAPGDFKFDPLGTSSPPVSQPLWSRLSLFTYPCFSIPQLQTRDVCSPCRLGSSYPCEQEPCAV